MRIDRIRIFLYSIHAEENPDSIYFFNIITQAVTTESAIERYKNLSH